MEYKLNCALLMSFMIHNVHYKNYADAQYSTWLQNASGTIHDLGKTILYYYYYAW